MTSRVYNAPKWPKDVEDTWINLTRLMKNEPSEDGAIPQKVYTAIEKKNYNALKAFANPPFQIDPGSIAERLCEFIRNTLMTKKMLGEGSDDGNDKGKAKPAKSHQPGTKRSKDDGHGKVRASDSRHGSSSNSVSKGKKPEKTPSVSPQSVPSPPHKKAKPSHHSSKSHPSGHRSPEPHSSSRRPSEHHLSGHRSSGHARPPSSSHSKAAFSGLPGEPLPQVSEASTANLNPSAQAQAQNSFIPPPANALVPSANTQGTSRRPRTVSECKAAENSIKDIRPFGVVEEVIREVTGGWEVYRVVTVTRASWNFWQAKAKTDLVCDQSPAEHTPFPHSTRAEVKTPPPTFSSMAMWLPHMKQFHHIKYHLRQSGIAAIRNRMCLCPVESKKFSSITKVKWHWKDVHGVDMKNEDLIDFLMVRKAKRLSSDPDFGTKIVVLKDPSDAASDAKSDSGSGKKRDSESGTNVAAQPDPSIYQRDWETLFDQHN